MLILYCIVILIIQCIITSNLKDDIGSLFWPFVCDEYNYIESIKLRFKLNCLFLGYKETDIYNYLEYIKRDIVGLTRYYDIHRDNKIYKDNCRISKFNEWLNDKENKEEN